MKEVDNIRVENGMLHMVILVLIYSNPVMLSSLAGITALCLLSIAMFRNVYFLNRSKRVEGALSKPSKPVKDREEEPR